MIDLAKKFLQTKILGPLSILSGTTKAFLLIIPEFTRWRTFIRHGPGFDYSDSIWARYCFTENHKWSQIWHCIAVLKFKMTAKLCYCKINGEHAERPAGLLVSIVASHFRRIISKTFHFAISMFRCQNWSMKKSFCQILWVKGIKFQ